ncbi:Clp protease N-terminal domain-containing protein [Kitasatospora purpeofusca]|uniref:AAA family ATPase n=1 Tax=Kitasatospora purpeofusca TaxID=67352 RepID=A0ABZ1TZD4_9ACTN|nr:Clp protease N-terminal domain-containing protein [Kitasatospora purpeofusca]
MGKQFTGEARKALDLADREALLLGFPEVHTSHLLLGLMRENEGVAAQVLRKLGCSLDILRRQHDLYVGPDQPIDPNDPPYTAASKRAIEYAWDAATAMGRDRIDTEHILLGLVGDPEEAAALTLANFNADHDVLVRLIQAVLTGPSPETADPEPAFTGILAGVTRNLTQEAADRPTVLGRGPDIDRVLQVLSRRARNVALLVGDPGVGKTSIAAGLAQAVVRGEVPERFRGRAVLRLDITALFSDPRQHGRFTEVMAELVQDILRSSDLVLFLDNALSVVRTREGQAEALAFFRPVFDVPGVSIVAAAGSADHRRWERDSGPDRRIQPVPMAEPAPEDVLQILRSARQRLVDHHEVVITDDALTAAARLAHGYLPGHALPGAAIDLLDEASAHVRSGPVTPGTTPSVTEELVTRTAGTSAALPVAPRPPVLSPPVPHDPTVWSMS